MDWCVVGFQFGVCASYFSFMTSTYALAARAAGTSFTVVLVPIVGVPARSHLRLGTVAQVATVTMFSLCTVGFFAIHRRRQGPAHNTQPFSGAPGAHRLLGSLC